jgi:hypothetical protein
MTKTLANYLGKPASSMLGAPPFKLWPVGKSFEEDLPELVIHYVFPQHGLELRCDPQLSQQHLPVFEWLRRKPA